jgi:DNA-binding MarR family transcriptional regulator
MGRMSTSPVPEPARYPAPSLLYLVKQLELAIRNRLEEALRDEGISPSQYTALTVLARREDLSTAQLARNSFVTDQSAAGLVTALEERGLVHRVRDPHDRRRRVLRLTRAGRALLDRRAADAAAIEARMLTGLAGDEAAELRRLVVHCRAALHDRAPH